MSTTLKRKSKRHMNRLVKKSTQITVNTINAELIARENIVSTAHQLEVHNESRLIKSSFHTRSTGTQFEDYIEASCSHEQELLVCSDSQDASDSQHDDSMSSNYSSDSDINYDMLEPE
ncbi:hypothetical protein JTB14_014328 [Gonioctena quinquepunctata]|nr:hypothetical protein JTB14_014328 [Gonioctena quinquepunctata]